MWRHASLPLCRRSLAAPRATYALRRFAARMVDTPARWIGYRGKSSRRATRERRTHAPRKRSDNVPMNRTIIGAAAALLALAGCGPALNWRAVPLPDAAITAMLPCKPDHATRSVELAGTPVQLTMAGCEADGATFAVSHVALPDPAQAGAALTHWRAAVLVNLGPGAAAATAYEPFVPNGALGIAQSVRATVHGHGADGQPVVAHAVWFARAAGSQMRLYHAVVFSKTPRPEAADTFFAGLALQ